MSPSVVMGVKNEAELVDAYTKQLKAHYTKLGMASGKECALNKRLEQLDLSGLGKKHEKCDRIASYLAKTKE